MVRHYELIIFYCLGGTAQGAIKRFGVSRSVAYSWYHRYKEGLDSLGLKTNKEGRKKITQKMFRLLEKTAPEVIYVPFYVPPPTKEKPIPPDDLSDER